MNLQKARGIARALMNEHGLEDWGLEFDTAKRRFGACHYTKRKITFSTELTKLNEAEDFIDVVLHEIAHAKVGSGHGHNRAWKLEALRVGASPTRCVDNDNIKEPEPKWFLVCPNCDNKQGRYRKAKRKHRAACGDCCRAYNGGRFSEEYILEYRRNPKH